jgi:hypothetical protein
VGGLAPRFLLPAYGLLAIPAAAGVTALLRARVPVRVLGVVTLAALAGWAVWQAATADRIEREQVAARAAPWAVGTELRQLAGRESCLFASTDSFPQIQLSSACRGHPAGRDLPLDASRLRAQGRRVFLVERSGHPVAPAGWRVVRSAPAGWVVLAPRAAAR